MVQPGGGVRRGLPVGERVRELVQPAGVVQRVVPVQGEVGLGVGVEAGAGYVVSWSEDMVKNGAGQGVAAYCMLVELETDVSACSADIVAEERL